MLAAQATVHAVELEMTNRHARANLLGEPVVAHHLRP